jgi:hypothetical protein
MFWIHNTMAPSQAFCLIGTIFITVSYLRYSTLKILPRAGSLVGARAALLEAEGDANYTRAGGEMVILYNTPQQQRIGK